MQKSVPLIFKNNECNEKEIIEIENDTKLSIDIMCLLVTLNKKVKVKYNEMFKTLKKEIEGIKRRKDFPYSRISRINAVKNYQPTKSNQQSQCTIHQNYHASSQIFKGKSSTLYKNVKITW